MAVNITPDSKKNVTTTPDSRKNVTINTETKKVTVNKCNFRNRGRSYIQKQTVRKTLNLLIRLISQND